MSLWPEHGVQKPAAYTIQFVLQTFPSFEPPTTHLMLVVGFEEDL